MTIKIRPKPTETLDLTVFKAVRLASSNGFRRGQIAVALAEYACQLVDIAYDEDRDMATKALELRLRALNDEYVSGDNAAIADERANILFPDRNVPSRRIIPRCLA